MRKFGVKLWSRDFVKNPEFARQSVASVKDGHFDYIELFAIPNTYDDLHSLVKDNLQNLPVIIHAPHSVFGVDTGNPERFEQNVKDLEASFRYADLLKAEIIILHPGFNEDERCLNESARQFQKLNDGRLAVENMPSFCTSTGRVLHGSSPEQVARIMKASGCNLCLDFSHAICAANHFGRDKYADLKAYQALKPVMYHLCDGDWSSDKDEHRHYGEGDYPLAKLLNDYTNADTFITMETGHGVPTDISPWIADIDYLKALRRG